MIHWLAVGVGGFLGAISRWQLSATVQKLATTLPIPLGVLGVNSLGSLLMGLFAGFSYAKGWWNTPLHLAIATGFLGAFTTYSSFSLEGVELLRSGKIGSAALYTALHLVVGWGLLALGWWLSTLRPQ